MTKKLFRIAIFECDTPVDAVHAKRGSYGDIFQDLLTQSLHLVGKSHGDLSLEVTKWDVVHSMSYPDLSEEKVDAILLTGSKHTAFHDDDWIVSLVAYVKQVLSDCHIPLIGICFGHQIIGRALGAQVGVSSGGWEISTGDIELSQLGSELLGTSHIVLHQMHRDAVLSLPEGAYNLGSSDRCNIQGMIVPGKAITVQAHPEFDDFIMENIIKTRRAQNVFDEGMAADGIARAKRQHNGVQICAAFLNYALSFK